MNTNLNNPNNLPLSSNYDRSPAATGRDFFVMEAGDIATTPFGDLQLISGSELISQSLARRIYTASVGYARFARSSASGGRVELLDEDYAASLYDRLSSGRTSEKDRAALEKLLNAVANERRVKLISYEIVPTQREPSKLSLQLTYCILGEDELKTLGLVLQQS